MSRSPERGRRRASAELVRLAELRRREFHDVRRPGRPDLWVDVLVCPSGVHVVTAATAGRVASNPATVTACREAAGAVAELLPPRYREKVRPVLRVVGDVAVADLTGDVIVTSETTLDHILRSSPVVLSTSEVNAVAARLEAQLEPYHVVPAAQRGRWRRRVLLLAAGLTAAAAAAASVVALVPGLPELPPRW